MKNILVEESLGHFLKGFFIIGFLFCQVTLLSFKIFFF